MSPSFLVPCSSLPTLVLGFPERQILSFPLEKDHLGQNYCFFLPVVVHVALLIIQIILLLLLIMISLVCFLFFLVLLLLLLVPLILFVFLVICLLLVHLTSLHFPPPPPHHHHHHYHYRHHHHHPNLLFIISFSCFSNLSLLLLVLLLLLLPLLHPSSSCRSCSSTSSSGHQLLKTKVGSDNGPLWHLLLLNQRGPLSDPTLGGLCGKQNVNQPRPNRQKCLKNRCFVSIFFVGSSAAFSSRGHYLIQFWPQKGAII